MPARQQIAVLVVDDDPGVRRLLMTLFQREMWDVEAAADGEIATSRARELDPDVIVLDLLLPKVSGFELLKRWNASEEGFGRRTVVLTAVAESQLRGVPRDSVWKIMRKPFDNEDLVRNVRECGSARRDARTAAARIGGTAE